MIFTTRRIAPWAGALLLLVASASRAALIVNQDLGVLPPGITNVVGDTSGGANNADIYFFTSSSTANWGNELVYQFRLANLAVVDLTLNSTNGDPDFFLLDGLTTAVDSGKNVAQDDLDLLTLDDPLPDSETFGPLPPGTYYLSVDAFSGFDPPPAIPASAMFDVDIRVAAVQPPSDFVDLGDIAVAGASFTVDSFGSDFDTILGVFDSEGFVVDAADDSNGTLQSAVDFSLGLPVGDYYIGLSGFDTDVGDGFVLEPFQGSEGGNFVLNYPGGPTAGTLASEETQWFRFSVVVPEPSSWLVLALSAALVGIARQAMP